MREQFYKRFKRGRTIAASELAGAKVWYHAAAEPANAAVPEGEWYCPNSDCVVMECTIRCKLHGNELPKMRCPACCSPIKFHHWIAHETLVPVTT